MGVLNVSAAICTVTGATDQAPKVSETLTHTV